MHKEIDDFFVKQASHVVDGLNELDAVGMANIFKIMYYLGVIDSDVYPDEQKAIMYDVIKQVFGTDDLRRH